MQVAEWIALIALIVAIGLGIASILATRRWGNRRSRLLFSCESVPMLPISPADDRLQVTYRDFAVPEPHLVTIRLNNIGPNDVTTKHFDDGSSLSVELNCTMFGVLQNSHPRRTVSRSIGSDAVVELTPGLLRRGDEWRVDIVVGGHPTPSLRSSLINTDIAEGPGTFDLAAELLSGVTIGLPFGIRIRFPMRGDV